MIGIDPINDRNYTIKSNAKVRIGHSCKGIILCNITTIFELCGALVIGSSNDIMLLKQWK